MLYHALEKLILQFIYIFFVRPFFGGHKRNSSNAATREKKTNSLIVKFFILMKVQSLCNAYCQRLDYYYYFPIVRDLYNTLNIVDTPILVYIPIASCQFEQVLPNLSSFNQSTVSSSLRNSVKPTKSEKYSRNFV